MPARAIFIASLLVLFTIDLPRIGFDLGTTERLVLLSPLGFGGAALWLQSDGLRRTLGVPAGLLLAAFAWITLVAPIGSDPIHGTVMAAALLGTVVLGLWYGATTDWDSALTVVGVALYGPLLAAFAIGAGTGSGTDHRWRGWAEEPNSLGTLAAIAILIGLAALGRRWWLVPLVPIGGFLLLVTEARLPAIAAVIGGTIVFRDRLGRGGPSLLIVAGLALSALVLSTDLVGDRLLRPEQVEEISTLNGRTPTWSLLTDELEAHPWRGFGPEATQDLLSSRSADQRVAWGPTHAHNAPLQMALHGGWPAAALFVASFVAYGLRARRRPHAVRDALVVCVVIVGVTEHLVREPSLPLFLVAAAFGASARHRGRACAEDRGEDRGAGAERLSPRQRLSMASQ